MLEINKEQLKEGKTAEIYTNLSEMWLHLKRKTQKLMLIVLEKCGRARNN